MEGKIERAVVVAGFEDGVHGFDTSDMEILAWATFTAWY